MTARPAHQKQVSHSRLPVRLAVLALVGALGLGAAHADGPGDARRMNRPALPAASNIASSQQVGVGNMAAIAQAGGDNVAVIRQLGDGNAGSIEQTGSSNTACLMQIGRDLSAGMVQTGNQTAGLVQTRLGRFEVPVDACLAEGQGRGHWRSVARRIR